MKIRLKTVVRVPYENKYLDKGTEMEVIDEKGNYFICRNLEKDIYSIFVQKDICEIIECY